MPAEGWFPDTDSQIKFDLDKAKGKQPGRRDHQENSPCGNRCKEGTSPLAQKMGFLFKKGPLFL